MIEVNLEDPNVVVFTNSYMTAFGRVIEKVIKVREKRIIERAFAS